MSFHIAKLPDFRPMEVKPEDRQWWFEQHDRYKWTYARTMPHSPHSYIWRDKEMTKDDYDRMFGAVRTFGTPGKYWDRTQLYLINPERNIRYWLMDRHYYTCLILNMATDGKEYGVQDAPSTYNPLWSEYDAIAPWWDDVYREHSEQDSAILWRLVHRNIAVAQPTILDLGAGTGATLEARMTPAEKVTAVDPSQGMLNDLVVKNPAIRNVFSGTAQQYFEERSGQRFDVTTASLGSGSYLIPAEIEQAYASTAGLIVLSFYGETPRHRTDMPATHHTALQAAIDLPGARQKRHGDYIYVVARGSSG